MTSTVRSTRDSSPPRWVMVSPESLTILGTYKCTATCKNCCFGSNPHITQRLDIEHILGFIREGSRYPTCKMVVFSGGECFLLRDDLNTAIQYASSLGLATRCVTNGFWAKRMAHGRARLASLVDAGLTELNISTGDFHQRWVSQESVVNAACLATEFRLRTLVVVELQKERRVTGEILARDPRIQAILTDFEKDFRLIESPWMPMDYKESIEQPDDAMLNRRTLHLRTGCQSVLKTLVVTPEQKVGYCCGLTRELIPELNAAWNGGSLDPVVEVGTRDFMKIWLSIDGPERILAWAATKNPKIEWENRYSHHCHSCLALFSDPLVREVLREHYRERVGDVLARYSTRLRIEQGMIHGADAEQRHVAAETGVDGERGGDGQSVRTGVLGVARTT